MLWRLVVLGVLATALASVTWLCVRVSGEMFTDGQQIYTTSGANQPSQKLMDAATRLFQTRPSSSSSRRWRSGPSSADWRCC